MSHFETNVAIPILIPCQGTGRHGGKVGDAGDGPLPRGLRRQRRTRRRGAFPLRSALMRDGPSCPSSASPDFNRSGGGTVRRARVVLERVLDIVVVDQWPIPSPGARTEPMRHRMGGGLHGGKQMSTLKSLSRRTARSADQGAGSWVGLGGSETRRARRGRRISWR